MTLIRMPRGTRNPRPVTIPLRKMLDIVLPFISVWASIANPASGQYPLYVINAKKLRVPHKNDVFAVLSRTSGIYRARRPNDKDVSYGIKCLE